jgi:hypothetical protein
LIYRNLLLTKKNAARALGVGSPEFSSNFTSEAKSTQNNPLFNQTSTAMANDSVTLRLVPVGDEGLDNDDYQPVSVEKIKKMIGDFKDKHTVKPDPKQYPQATPEVFSCWLCLDAVLRLFELDPEQEKTIKQIVKEGKVSGIRIHKGLSKGKQNFVFTTTREETIEELKGQKSTVQIDRLEEGSRVLYIDEDHFDDYGGSMCPPNCKN